MWVLYSATASTEGQMKAKTRDTSETQQKQLQMYKKKRPYLDCIFPTELRVSALSNGRKE